MKAIEIKNLTKNYGSLTALDNISLDVNKGEIFAFLGPNGAGKSTLIKILTSVLFPSSGKIKVNNYDLFENKKEIRESIGVIFQDTSLDKELTAYENLLYHAVLFNVPKKEREKKITELLEYVDLGDRKDNFIKTFSGGMKRRIEIARGLLHSPSILFLDEPTLGLDVQTKKFLWDYIKKINKTKKITIFFTTHNMDEAEKIATKIAIIDKGKIMAIGSSKEIKKKTKTKSLEDAFLKITGRSIRDEKPDALDSMRKRWNR